ncbi:hypothetical protein G5I_01330 [Acromyrmex echinatior]|uniref:Uncharacterized protein n=1 Tax=Acromyrmex echinatior TaxID=103372 RepID=F4W7B5_ACREC|nr:hypothetical protein G5I_01330 [Acromyrmex echinatior]
MDIGECWDCIILDNIANSGFAVQTSRSTVRSRLAVIASSRSSWTSGVSQPVSQPASSDRSRGATARRVAKSADATRRATPGCACRALLRPSGVFGTRVPDPRQSKRIYKIEKSPPTGLSKKFRHIYLPCADCELLFQCVRVCVTARHTHTRTHAHADELSRIHVHAARLAVNIDQERRGEERRGGLSLEQLGPLLGKGRTEGVEALRGS